MPEPTFDWEPDPGKLPLLVVEDAPDAQYFYEKALRSSPFQIYPAYTLREAETRCRTMLPGGGHPGHRARAARKRGICWSG